MKADDLKVAAFRDWVLGELDQRRAEEMPRLRRAALDDRLSGFLRQEAMILDMSKLLRRGGTGVEAG